MSKGSIYFLSAIVLCIKADPINCIVFLQSGGW